MNKVLFVVKRRDGFDQIKHCETSMQCGLYNSISYVHTMLLSQGVESQLSICIDNNCINGFVYKFKPTHVIVEALWVVPEKIILLQSMYPSIIWIIRLHSAMPFFAIESSQSMKWCAEYIKIPNVFLSVNDKRILNELNIYINIIKNDRENLILYLPNFYPQNMIKKKITSTEKDTLDISCFGAIRPFKNILTQAIASVEFCKKIDKKLRFHINSDRNELNGLTVFTNLENLFTYLPNDYTLIKHPWMPRDEFLVLCGKIDIGLQVSFTETFNIVSADIVSSGVAVVGSSEIPWINDKYITDPVDVNDIIEKMFITYNNLENNIQENQEGLINYTNDTIKIWMKYFTPV